MTSQLRAAVLLIALLTSSCATIHPNTGFSDVDAAVKQRIGATIVWNNRSELDHEAEEKIRSTLKGTLTSDQVVQIALLNNRELQAVYSGLGVALADLVQAGLLRNPIFDAAITFPTSGGRADLELTTVMDFLDVFFIPLRKRVAAARLEETKIRLTGFVFDFAGQSRKAFSLHQASEQMLELRQTIVQALSASLEVARRLHEAGNISDLDFARQRAFLENGKLALRSAESAVNQSREQLNVLMGLWGEQTQWQVDKRLPDIPPEVLQTEGIETVAIEKSLELGSARQRIIAAGEQLGFARATAWLPESAIGSRAERQEGSWSAGPVFEFPIPVFDQGQARRGRAGAELRRAQQEYYALAVRIRSTARSIRDRLSAARDRALYTRDILLPLHERIVNETELYYNAMQVGVFELLRAREQQIQTAAAYIEALRDYSFASADFNQLQTGRLPLANIMTEARTATQTSSGTSQGH